MRASPLRSLVLICVVGLGLPACSMRGATVLQPAASAERALPATAGGPSARTGAVIFGAKIPRKAAHPSGWLSPQAKRARKLVYVSDVYDNIVDIYPAGTNNPAPIGQITDGLSTPDGITVDAEGNLYVSNAGSSTVTVYRPGTIRPFKTYSPGNNPVDVVVGADGTTYVALGLEGCMCIFEYVRGSMKPKQIVPFEHTGGSPLFMTFDSAGNVDVSLTNATVYEVIPGRRYPTNLGLTGLGNPRGIGYDAAGALLVANIPPSGWGEDNEVLLYPAGAKAPQKQIVVGPQPFEVAFGAKGTRMYVADLSWGESGYIGIFDAKHRWKQVGTIAKGLYQPIGVALSPGVR